jgi:hydroxyacylglutathione hydrolase
MRVTRHLHLAASGAAGLSLTHPLDCNAWLIDSEDGLLLFDTGAGVDIDAVLAEISAGGADPARLRHIFLTHAHADHSGGVAALQDRLLGVTLHAGSLAAKRMASHDESAISLDSARRFGIYPPDYLWCGATVDDVLHDGDSLRIGSATIRMVETPGHSSDHCSYLIDIDGATCLIAGDAIFENGKVVLQDIPDCSVPALLDSIRRLAALEFHSFLPGHGTFSVQDGMRHVARGRHYAESGQVPPSLFG